MTFVGRKNELDWLDAGRRLGQALIIEGLSGVGKTALIEEWTRSRSLHPQWRLFREFTPAQEMILASDTPGRDLTVWDNVQHLNKEDFMSLVTRIAEDRSGFHILLSDRKLSVIHSGKFSCLVLKPLTKDEMIGLCQSFGRTVDLSAATALWSTTGGLPSLIKFWLHTNENPNLEFKLQLAERTPEYRSVLALFSAALMPLTVKQIRTVLPWLEGELVQLTEQFIISKNEQGYEIQSSLREFIWQKLDPLEQSRAHQRLADHFSQPTSRNYLLAYAYHTLLGGDEVQIQKVLDGCDLDLWESLNVDLVPSLLDGIQRLSDKIRTSAVCKRTQLRLKFLNGQRNQVSSVAKEILQKWSEHEVDQFLAAECLQYCNRVNDYQFVIAHTPELLRYASGLPRAMIFVELGVALHIGKGDYELALRQFELAIKLVQTDLAKNSTYGQQLLATTYFEMARVFDMRSQYEIAKLHYKQAVEYFSKCQKEYFTSVSLLNLAWVALKTQNWDELCHYKKLAYQLASKHGYAYVRAGLMLVEAIYESLHLRFSRALQLSEQSINFLGESAPPLAMVDALSERLRLLAHLGLMDEAHRTFSSIEKLVSQNQLQVLNPLLQSLKTELHLFSLDRDDWSDQFKEMSSKGESSLTQMHLLTFVGEELSPADRAVLGSCPLGLLRLYEIDLIHLREKNSVNLWPLLNSIERVLEHNHEPCAERVAMYIMRSYLRDTDAERNNDLRLARVELTRWGCDRDVKRPLELWLRASESRTSPQQLSEWSSCLQGLQDRWQGWFRGLTNTGTSQIENITNTDVPLARPDFYIDEALGEVVVRGVRSEELSRSSSLRELLILILEGSPKVVSKETLVKLIWHENYSPLVHDARIYTAIQRLRRYLGSPAAILSLQRGYRWNDKWTFVLQRKKTSEHKANNRVQLLILRALAQGSAAQRLSRLDLVQIAESSDATVKRELAKLLEKNQITRHGRGRSTFYTLHLSS